MKRSKGEKKQQSVVIKKLWSGTGLKAWLLPPTSCVILGKLFKPCDSVFSSVKWDEQRYLPHST